MLNAVFFKTVHRARPFTMQRRGEGKDNSKNSLPIDFLMMGELYQNNHHKKPNNLNFAEKWFELDIGYLTCFFLKKIKIIYSK